MGKCNQPGRVAPVFLCYTQAMHRDRTTIEDLIKERALKLAVDYRTAVDQRRWLDAALLQERIDELEQLRIDVGSILH